VETPLAVIQGWRRGGGYIADTIIFGGTKAEILPVFFWQRKAVLTQWK
jgi:hypothetical protein